MKARFFHVCQARGGGKLDMEEIEIEFEIPFVPVAGMMISPNAGSDLLQVDDVYWFADRPNELELFAVNAEDLRSFAYWRKQGWRRSQ